MNARLLPASAVSALAAEEFRWPAPPYFEFVREQDRLDWSDCALALRDGTRSSGRMCSFVPDAGLLRFNPVGTDELVSVAFSDLLKLELQRPVEVRREGASATVTESDAQWRSENQPFRIELENGELFQGVTLGSVSALCGLFLFSPQAKGSIVRCFVPAHASGTLSIGAPIGRGMIRQEAAVAGRDLQATQRMRNAGPLLAPVTVSDERSGELQGAGTSRRGTLALGETQRPRIAANGGLKAVAVMEKLRANGKTSMEPVTAVAEDGAAAPGTRGGAAASIAIEVPGLRPGRNHVRGAPQAAQSAARADAAIQDLISRLTVESGNQDIAEQQAARSDSALVKLVDRIILDAVQHKVSDIHIEANQGPKTTSVRFRKDGTLVNYLELPAQFRNAVVSRIKIMSQLDITERRKPQDGKIDFSRFGPTPVELRVATVPTTGGLEDVVMRVFGASGPVPLNELDLDPDGLDSIKRLISQAHGLFLVCGPTGSGKTTTLHSLLAFLNTSERKIWTAEDPIEITQPGLRQVQVHPKIGWTFAAAMRSFMRADPDVIMVGEMRDTETAKIAIEASLTGHLVLSTLHTNSAAESIVRMLDLGMDPFNFADALLGVLAQRLAKRLCPECKSGYAPSPAELEQLLLEYGSDMPIDAEQQLQTWRDRYGGRRGLITLYCAKGCEHCDHTGYLGRIGLHELLVTDPVTKRLIQSRAPIAEVKQAAMTAGLRTLRQDGLEKVLQGLTDIRQVNAVSS